MPAALACQRVADSASSQGLSSQQPLPSRPAAAPAPALSPVSTSVLDGQVSSNYLQQPSAAAVLQAAADAGGAEHGVPQPVQLALDNLLTEFKAHTSEVMVKSQQQVQSELNSTVAELVRKLDSNFQRQIQAQQQQHSVANSEAIVRLEKQVAELLTSQAQIFARIQTGQIDIRETTNQSSANVRSKWNLAPDRRLVKANCATLISLRAFADLVVPLLANLGCQLGTDYNLPGDPNILAKYFSVYFTGPEEPALSKATRLLESMRTGPGKWRQIFAATPSGSTTQVFLGPDKSLKVQALEVTTKRFSAILAAEVGASWAEGLYTMRSEGLVFFNWEPLAKVEVEEGGKVTVGWNPAVADLLRLDQSGIVKALTAEAKAAAEAGKGAGALRARAAHAQWQL